MQLSVSVEDTNQVLNLEISNDLTLKELKNLINFEINLDEFDVLLNGNTLREEDKTLKDLGFEEDELVLVQKKVQPQQPLPPQQRPSVDPFSQEYQQRLYQQSPQSKIDEALEHALENTPEIFGSISMLYINLTLNGTPVKAFVDSGAQQTIISPRLAEKCDLTSLIDKRFQGLAMGVGSTKIEGRIHSAMLKIEKQFFPASLTVLDTHVDFLLGLDMLRRYQGVIDLERNVLRLAGVETSFLSEAEIPKNEIAGAPAPLGASGFGGNIFTPGSINPHQQVPTTAPITAPVATNNTTTTTAAPAAAATTFSEVSINQLVSLGVSRQEAIDLLKQTGGNLELAASLLFQ